MLIRYPSFNLTELSDAVNFDEKKLICAISSPRFVVPISLLDINFYGGICGFIKNILIRLRYYKIKYYFDLSLHKYRVDIFHFFCSKNTLDLYGYGWNRKNIFPHIYSLKLFDIKNMYIGEIGNKIEVLKNYKFSLIIENASTNNYLTEKIFQCFAAKVVPVYYGAINVERFIPPGSFINLRSFFYSRFALFSHLAVFCLPIPSLAYQVRMLPISAAEQQS